MRRRSAPARMQSDAQSRRARSNTEEHAARAIRVLQNRRTPSPEEQGTRWEGPAVSIHTTGRYQWLVFSVACILTMAVLSLQRCLSTAISTLKEMILLKKKRCLTILFLISLSILAGACCEALLLMWRLQAKDLAEMLMQHPEAQWKSPGNMLTECQEHVPHEMQQLRHEVSHMAAEIIAMKKEAQEMQEAMSATTWISDWALKSAGACVDLQRLSSTSWLCRVLGLRCTVPVQDTFVQPDFSPGYCWPFQGTETEVLIRLPVQIQPMAITLQHTSSTAAPPGIRGSAPRDFSVYGLDEEGKDKTLLGTFTYAMQEELTQTFPLQLGIPGAFRFLQLDVRSNWGKPRYTCIYRVQVHGKSVGRKAMS
ncbi:sperm-associated antigen 4 protein-like [Heliangelus exortis]|uniref:sperm-associated antigen 4 protein-like n=1 Tax=Heliangelus exortis TaxID=472823 RepID=UPI003A933E8F